MAVRRSPRRHQLLRAGRSGGDDAVLHRFGAGDGRRRQYAGTTILRDEQQRALAFVNGLADAQRAKAVLSFSKTGNNILAEAWKDNVVLDYAGLRATELTDAQRRQLIDLVGLYVGNMDDGHARVRMDEVRQHLDRTWFAWIGKTDPALAAIGGLFLTSFPAAGITGGVGLVAWRRSPRSCSAVSTRRAGRWSAG